jgi:predicted DNA repair protein MutK
MTEPRQTAKISLSELFGGSLAGSNLLALIDDIATLLDDVSVMTKVAAKKTSGVLGDDLALNAQQVSGVDPTRELPVVLSVAKGSFINKVILVPLALLLSLFVPVLIKPLLVIGGLFLCYEGFEKVFEKFVLILDRWRPSTLQKTYEIEIISEKEKIKGAVRTDFILSAEILVITLGTVANETLARQAMVLVSISLLMTVGVYGLVAGIVKLDDLGLWLSKKSDVLMRALGRGLLAAAPLLMKFLGVVGTAAMFLVGGGLINHSLPVLHQLQEGMGSAQIILFDAIVGIFAGAIVLGIKKSFFKLYRFKRN